MQFQVALRVLPLPGLDQKERDRARGMNGKVGYAPVKPGVSPLAPVGVATMCAQRANALDHGREAAKNLADIVRDQRIEVGAVCSQAERFADRTEQRLDVLLVRKAVSEFDQNRPAKRFQPSNTRL